jgi:DNA polymerase-3 subunit epsilon
MLTLVIDFETANMNANSACAVGMVVLENHQIIHTESLMIRPPEQRFQFTAIHGITWARVALEPNFEEHWHLKLKQWFKRADTLVAHNVGFDSRVLKATAGHYSIRLPELKKVCTVQISKNQLDIKPSNLAHVSKTLGISLNHHEAMSDAMASAYIYLYSQTGDKIWQQKKAKPTEADSNLNLDLDRIGAMNSKKSLELMKSLLKGKKLS